MKKRVFSLLIALCMVFALLPSTVLAADGNGDKISMSTTLDFTASDAPADCTVTGVGNQPHAHSSEADKCFTWNNNTKTLTLNNLNLETSAATAINLPDGAKVVMNGVSTVKNSFAGNSSTHGIYCYGSLTFEGIGSLTVTAGSSTKGSSYGVIATRGSITVSGGTLTANSGTSAGGSSQSIAAFAQTNFTVSGGTLNANSGTATGTDSSSCGAYSASGIIAVSGGTLNAKSEGAGGNSYGASTYSGKIEVSGAGRLTAIGGTSTAGNSYGAATYSGNIEVVGTGTLTATGGASSAGVSYGAYTNKDTTANIVVSGGTLEAKSGTGATAQAVNKAPAAGGGATLTVTGNQDGSSGLTAVSDLATNFAAYKHLKIVVTPAPSAIIGDVTVSGTTGTAITATDVTVTLSNEKFNVLAAGADVSTWFNLPAGLTAKIKADVAQDATSATVTVSGTPTATSTAEMTATIPAASLVGNAALAVTTNANAKWNIAAPVATPTFSPAAGAYSTTQSVTLSCATAGASIYYTTDETTPTAGSTPYSGAISVSQDTTIKAIAIKTGMADSAVASAGYSIIPLTVSGSSNFVEKTANGDAVFTIGAGIANFTATKNFQSATLDGIALDLGTVGTPGTDGSIEDGSIILKINSTKLNNLSVGSHTLVVTLKDGSYAGKTVSSTITVTAAGGGTTGGTTTTGSTSPSTGDTSGLSIWVVLATLSGTGAALLAGTCIKKRKAAAKTK